MAEELISKWNSTAVNNAVNENDMFSILYYYVCNYIKENYYYYRSELPQHYLNSTQTECYRNSMWNNIGCQVNLSESVCTMTLTWIAGQAVAVVTRPALAGKWSLGVLTHSLLVAPAWLALVYVFRQDKRGVSEDREDSRQAKTISECPICCVLL